MKIQKIMMKKYSILFAFFIGLSCYGQNYKGDLVNIEKDGLHKILLTPEIRSASANNFDFIRIQNSKEQEVPYVLKLHTDRFLSQYIPIKIQTNKRIKDSVTSIILENKARQNLSKFTLKVANNSLSKKYNIFGSDDKKKWFGISSNQRIGFTNNSSKAFVEKNIEFPVNNYRFLKIEFKDKHSLPINVLGIGFYQNKFFSEKPTRLENFGLETVQIKDEKTTRLLFKADGVYKINALSFAVNTPFFLRNAKIIVTRQRTVKKRVEEFEQVLSSFQLNSKKTNSFNFKNLKEKEFIIEIDNQDNPPLNITDVRLLQNPVYLISSLKKEENYKIIIDTTYRQPSYDLGSFISDEIPSIEKATITSFSKIETKKGTAAEKPFWQTPLFMWVCIGLVGLLVVYIAFSLLKDISSQKNK